MFCLDGDTRLSVVIAAAAVVAVELVVVRLRVLGERVARVLLSHSCPSLMVTAASTTLR